MGNRRERSFHINKAHNAFVAEERFAHVDIDIENVVQQLASSNKTALGGMDKFSRMEGKRESEEVG